MGDHWLGCQAVRTADDGQPQHQPVPIWIPDDSRQLSSGQDPYGSYSGGFNPAVDRYLNSAAFFDPASFQFGDLGRYNNWVRGPAANSEPLSAQKRINITERVITELRIDATNPYNIVRWSNPNTSITGASLGVISGAQGARVAQLNLTLKF
jgi:hypothetical protein